MYTVLGEIGAHYRNRATEARLHVVHPGYLPEELSPCGGS